MDKKVGQAGISEFEEPESRHHRRANRMRWCKGKPGVAHDWNPVRCVLAFGGIGVSWTVCRACSKKRYIGSF